MATETCVQQKVDDILADPEALLRVLAALGISTTRSSNKRGDESDDHFWSSPNLKAPPSIIAQINQCQATTQKGRQCSRAPGVGSEYCWQHVGSVAATRPRTVELSIQSTFSSEQCMATTQQGRQCSRRLGAGSEYCWQHVGASTTNILRAAETPIREPTLQSNRCLAITQKGSQCSRQPKAGSGGDYCWQHIGHAKTVNQRTIAPVEDPPIRNSPSVNQCMATTQKGSQCKRSPQAGSGSSYCWQHVGQAEPSERAVVESRVLEASETEQREDIAQGVGSTTDLPVETNSVSGTTEVDQCMATTKAGHRCSRRPEAGTVHGYCWQHKGLAVSAIATAKVTDEPQPALQARKSKPIEYERWIREGLSSETKAKLRTKMTESPSRCEIPGYVYAFEIIDPATPEEVHIKVGYSKDVRKRLRGWQRQCPSKRILLRGCWPCALQMDNVDGETGRQVESIGPGEPTSYPHRVEQLVHLELKEVAAYSLHIKPECRKPIELRSSMRGPCSDCNKMHREIFSFQRYTSSKLRGKEFDLVVLPVIKRWGMFVSKHVQ
ncbi:hypothetical protein FRC12_006281 [Ceratobasidium sp. 428]|nr:hypothetical protein FRC12_006281 [Ceratobasidium sp. 428]